MPKRIPPYTWPLNLLNESEHKRIAALPDGPILPRPASAEGASLFRPTWLTSLNTEAAMFEINAMPPQIAADLLELLSQCR